MFFYILNLTVKIDLVVVAYHLKIKQVFHLLSKLYDKSVSPADLLLFINMIDI